MIKHFIDEYARYKASGEKAMEQVSDEALHKILSTDNNSIATVARHVSGNLASRFTDFLTTDGEKSWRNRDSEFEDAGEDRSQILERWKSGWSVLELQLGQLAESDMDKIVYIRGQAHTVHEALCRSLAHTAYHVGQMVTLARIFTGEHWQWITIPKGQSASFKPDPTSEKKPQ
jgi:hypothetical protein